MVWLWLGTFLFRDLHKVFSEVFEDSENRPVLLDMKFSLLSCLNYSNIRSTFSISLSLISDGLIIMRREAYFSAALEAAWVGLRNSLLLSFISARKLRRWLLIYNLLIIKVLKMLEMQAKDLVVRLCLLFSQKFKGWFSFPVNSFNRAEGIYKREVQTVWRWKEGTVECLGLKGIPLFLEIEANWSFFKEKLKVRLEFFETFLVFKGYGVRGLVLKVIVPFSRRVAFLILGKKRKLKQVLHRSFKEGALAERLVILNKDTCLLKVVVRFEGVLNYHF